MGTRLELQTLLETILPNVYFQPPAGLTLVYPCIIYSRDRVKTDFAADKPYNRRKRYSVTVIDRNPDSIYPDQVGALPLCEFDRFFIADNLNHDVFKLYF